MWRRQGSLLCSFPTGGRRTMFKLPMDENMSPSCVCNISAQTQRAELIRKSDLIIWDELPTTHRFCVEALDRTLKDLMHNTLLFGGKTIFFSGDWRQTGPIVKFGSPTDTVDAAVISSHLWSNIFRLRLTKSQRDRSVLHTHRLCEMWGKTQCPQRPCPTEATSSL